MLLIRIKPFMMLPLVLGLGIGTAMVAYPSPGQEGLRPKQVGSKRVSGDVPTDPENPPTPQKTPERVDWAGDPLPVGASARFGTSRFRLGNPVQGLAFGPEGKSLVASDWSGIYVWDAATGKELRRIGGNFQTHLSSCAFSSDGKRVAACITDGQSGTINVWDVQSGAPIGWFSAPAWSQVVLSANGNLMAYCSQGKIHLWDVTHGQELGPWTIKEKEFCSIAVAPDGKTLVYAGEDNAIHVLETTTGKEIRRLTGHGDDVGRLFFSPSGRYLASVGLTVYEYNMPNGKATVGMSDNRLHLWDFHSGKEVRQFEVPKQEESEKPEAVSNGIAGVAFSHDGKRLAASATLAKDKHVRIWDVSTGAKVVELPVTGGTLAFSADDKILATSGTGAIQLWDSRSGKELEVAKGHQGSILSLAVSPDNRLVASAGVDGTVRLWEPATGKELQRIVDPEDGATGVTFCPDGRTLAISGTNFAFGILPLGGKRADCKAITNTGLRPRCPPMARWSPRTVWTA
jgi:WD40 repeat protein